MPSAAAMPGRFIVGRLLVPSLVLTTTGRRSGEPRDAPLACMPADGGWYVVGSTTPCP
ncbi:MAG: nitroreductase/quinone reductase family protein [Mycobacterium sp.]